MKRNKFITVILFSLLLCISAVSADDVKAGSIKVPAGNKVILVGRISFKNPIDFAARKDALAAEQKGTISIGVSKDKNYYVIGKPSISTMGEMWELGEMFYFSAKPDKDGTITLDTARGILFGFAWNYFLLPMQVKISVPEGAKFVYVGNFQYDLDYALRVKGFKHFDEFDDAQKLINRATGKNVELMRGELNFIK